METTWTAATILVTFDGAFGRRRCWYTRWASTPPTNRLERSNHAVVGAPALYYRMIYSTEKRFREVGIPEETIRSLVCPIGLPGIADKDPAVIAASVTAQLLQVREHGSGDRNLSPPTASNDT